MIVRDTLHDGADTLVIPSDVSPDELVYARVHSALVAYDASSSFNPNTAWAVGWNASLAATRYWDDPSSSLHLPTNPYAFVTADINVSDSNWSDIFPNSSGNALRIATRDGRYVVEVTDFFARDDFQNNIDTVVFTSLLDTSGAPLTQNLANLVRTNGTETAYSLAGLYGTDHPASFNTAWLANGDDYLIDQQRKQQTLLRNGTLSTAFNSSDPRYAAAIPEYDRYTAGTERNDVLTGYRTLLEATDGDRTWNGSGYVNLLAAQFDPDHDGYAVSFSRFHLGTTGSLAVMKDNGLLQTITWSRAMETINPKEETYLAAYTALRHSPSETEYAFSDQYSSYRSADAIFGEGGDDVIDGGGFSLTLKGDNYDRTERVSHSPGSLASRADNTNFAVDYFNFHDFINLSRSGDGYATSRLADVLRNADTVNGGNGDDLFIYQRGYGNLRVSGDYTDPMLGGAGIDTLWMVGINSTQVTIENTGFMGWQIASKTSGSLAYNPQTKDEGSLMNDHIDITIDDVSQVDYVQFADARIDLHALAIQDIVGHANAVGALLGTTWSSSSRAVAARDVTAGIGSEHLQQGTVFADDMTIRDQSLVLGREGRDNYSLAGRVSFAVVAMDRGDSFAMTDLQNVPVWKHAATGSLRAPPVSARFYSLTDWQSRRVSEGARDVILQSYEGSIVVLLDALDEHGQALVSPGADLANLLYGSEFIGGAGADLIRTDNGNGLDGNDTLYALEDGASSTENDVAWSWSPGADFGALNATERLDGGRGADDMHGSRAESTAYFVDDISDRVFEDAETGVDRDTSHPIVAVLDSVVVDLSDYILPTGIENGVRSGATLGRLTGNSLYNQLVGGSGNDTLVGGPGNDTLFGSAGADVLDGGTGDDRYIVRDTQDTIVELVGAGIDEVWINGVSDYELATNVEKLLVFAQVGGSMPPSMTLRGNALDNTFSLQITDSDVMVDGGLGADTVNTLGVNGRAYVDNPGDVVNGSGLILVKNDITYSLAAGSATRAERLSPGWLIGSAAANVLRGSSGDDLLDGAGGGDQLYGGLGDDGYEVRGADLVFEAADAGSDWVMAYLSYVAPVNVEEVDLAWNTPVALNATGNTANNQLNGNEFDNTLIGLGGDDTLDGGVGVDSLVH